MRLRGHKQKPEPRNVTCAKCQKNQCEQCVDALLLAIGRDKNICQCDRPDHQARRDGEPRVRQVLDPISGSVFTESGVEVTVDGEVRYPDPPFGENQNKA